MKYLSTLIILLIPLVIIFQNTSFLVTNYGFYQKIYKSQNIYGNFSNRSILDSETENLLGYFRGKNLLDHKFYSLQAIIHLKDVKNLLNIAKYLGVTFLVILFSITAFLIRKKEIKKLANAWITGSLATIFLTIAISSLMVFGFQRLFTGFHLVLFRNNNWLFEPSDNLIKMFPLEFFISFAFGLTADTIVTALVVTLSALVIRKINDKPYT